MSRIKNISATKIPDSRGRETIEVKLETDNGQAFFDSVPSGTSTGKNEAVSLPADQAVKNVNEIICSKITGFDTSNQKQIDQLLIELDSTKNKSKLGANAILAVSMAVARSGAENSHKALFSYLNEIHNQTFNASISPSIPMPMMVIMEGGKHAPKECNLCIQEFLVMASTDKGTEILQEVEKILKKRNIKYDIGLEGAYSPQVKYDEDAIEIIQEAIKSLNLTDVKIGLDVSGSNCLANIDNIADLFLKHNLYSLEDPFAEDDWQRFSELKKMLDQTHRDYLLIGDDLFCTNKNLLQKGIEQKSANAIIIKLNQIGTVSEALEVVNLAKKNNFKCIVSHRSGETKDTFIADFSVAIAAEFLKAGAPTALERKLKYERLSQIKGEM